MSAAAHLSARNLGPRMVAHCFRGTFSELMAQKRSVLQDGSSKLIAIGYNTGMASGDEKLKLSWKADVQELLQQNILTIFTCANDHSDLKCENKLMATAHAEYVLLPRKNLFSAVTTLHPPGQQATGWYSANAFIYAVQGKSPSNLSRPSATAMPQKPCISSPGSCADSSASPPTIVPVGEAPRAPASSRVSTNTRESPDPHLIAQDMVEQQMDECNLYLPD